MTNSDEAKATRRAAALIAASIPIGLALCVAFYQVSHQPVRAQETWATFSGDCANIRAEYNADRREAKVTLPPGCHYTNSNY